MTDLDKLRPEVREALWHIRPASRARFQLKSWETIRAELLRLAVRNAELEAKATRDHEWGNDLLTENKKAEAELLRLVRDNDALRSKCNVIMSGSTRHLGRAERAEAERDALRKQIPTVDELHALERCHKSQEVLRMQLDKANPDDPYASLMVEEDAMLLAGLIERFHAAQR